jgi:MFS family permease
MMESAHSDRNAYKNYKENRGHLILFMTLVSLSGITIGYGLGYTANTLPVINAVFGWESSKEIDLNDSLISSAFSFGAAFGASSGGKLIGRGRRLTMLGSIIIGIVGCTISVF